ncbi:2-hydroxyacid dehydrogenase [Aquibacillus saliphilus]|uniref:2-hydroxyacid dehydrogenase n=1 Tax=Aquibacillus saliphilus TaxID=1909422 RepID=UPI001CEFF26D|nr:D-glycerate dehydrogenase [Aquibacillus saliphilus]
MKPKVLITEQLPSEIIDFIGEHCNYSLWEHDEKIPRDELLKRIEDVDGLLTSKDSVDEELLARGKNLKIVCDVAVGYDNFDIEAIKKHGILATHTPFVLDETVADLVFGLVLSTGRRLTELDHNVKNGKWDKPVGEDWFGTDVHGATMGIIGMGRIGEKVARRATLGFNMNVLYYNRTQKPEVEKKLNVTYSSLENLLAKSDYVVVLTPHTDQTHQLIGEREFNLMKEKAFFINCSRGQVINEQALINALHDNQIAGAGLDVFEQEPINKDNPLLGMNNVVTLPHIGSATMKTRFDMKMSAAKSLVAGVTGETPMSIIKELGN